jgi:hypothetical protein
VTKCVTDPETGDRCLLTGKDADVTLGETVIVGTGVGKQMCA